MRLRGSSRGNEGEAITDGKVTTVTGRPRECEEGAVEKLGQQPVRGSTHARARTSHITPPLHGVNPPATPRRQPPQAGCPPSTPRPRPQQLLPRAHACGPGDARPPPPPTPKFRTPSAPLWRPPPSQRPGSQLTEHEDSNGDSVDNKEGEGGGGVDVWWRSTARARAGRRVDGARLYSCFRMGQSQLGSGVPRAHPPQAHRPQGGGGGETPALGV